MSVRSSGTFRWRGNGAGTKSAWNDGRNWVDANGSAWAQAQYPGYDGATVANVDGDLVLFDAAPTTALAGYNASGLGALGALRIDPAYNLGIASSGTYLQVNLQTTAECIVNGAAAGNIYLKGAGANGLSAFTLLNLTSSGTPSVLSLDGALGRVTLLKGKVSILATASISSLTVGYVSSKTADVLLTIASGATLPAMIQATGGTVTCNQALTTLNLQGGIWTQSGDVTTLVIGDTGDFVWMSGTLTTMQLLGAQAILDASQSTTARTCTSLYQLAGATVNLNNGGRGVTITTWDIECSSPSIQVTPGQLLTITG